MISAPLTCLSPPTLVIFPSLTQHSYYTNCRDSQTHTEGTNKINNNTLVLSAPCRLLPVQHGNTDGQHCWDDLMAAPMEPDINPINTDHHASTYFTANTTSSLKQTLLILSESLPPTVNISSMSMWTNTVRKYTRTYFSENYKQKKRGNLRWFFSKSNISVMKYDISIHGALMFLLTFTESPSGQTFQIHPGNSQNLL